jgi:hypothetical protein
MFADNLRSHQCGQLRRRAAHGVLVGKLEDRRTLACNGISPDLADLDRPKVRQAVRVRVRHGEVFVRGCGGCQDGMMLGIAPLRSKRHVWFSKCRAFCEPLLQKRSIVARLSSQARAEAQAARERLVPLDVRLKRLLDTIPPEVQTMGFLWKSSERCFVPRKGAGGHCGAIGGELRRMGWRRIRSWKKTENGFRAFWFPPS